MQRLQMLLPQLDKSNKELDAKIASGADVDIEHTGNSRQIIQMDLSMGVATLPDEFAQQLAPQPFILLPDDDQELPKALTPVTPNKKQQKQQQQQQHAAASTRPLIEELN